MKMKLLLQVLGMWYGSEILTHHDNDMGELVYDACVVIHLAEITHEVICR